MERDRETETAGNTDTYKETHTKRHTLRHTEMRIEKETKRNRYMKYTLWGKNLRTSELGGMSEPEQESLL